MPLDPICILDCKQCFTMNEYRICWFFQGKNICVMFVFSIVSFMFFYSKYVCSKYCTRLKSTSIALKLFTVRHIQFCYKALEFFRLQILDFYTFISLGMKFYQTPLSFLNYLNRLGFYFFIFLI